MITNKFNKISRKEFTNNCLNADGSATYQVSGVEIEDILGDMENLNDLLVDQVIEDGYLLEGVSYKFVGRASDDGTTTIQVDIESVQKWLSKND